MILKGEKMREIFIVHQRPYLHRR